ncbi:hypothetical protein [Brevundimonas sp. MF30-B]|uniref:hypothetical protein n=1 Tax=Brevundimonas sp. MF30-B TaxID=2561924 RepID=UPI001076AAB7|nr:hypothetical protein [Brevundimonas sp. MF30-B]QBX38120.1 hypothetical protein E4M01_10290 [Brevundimonas sp. MF30-B]
MAKARLKVFSWSDGFHAFSVAASSRAKALRAWGMHRDIFKDGLAKEIHDGPDYDAAMADPGEVIQRGEAIDKSRLGRRPAPQKAAAPSAAEKRRKALQAEADRLDQEWAAAQAALDEREADLAKERDQAAGAHRQARNALMKKMRALR